MPSKKKTVFIADDLHQQLKRTCTRFRMTMTEVVESEVRRWLENGKAKPPPAPKNEGPATKTATSRISCTGCRNGNWRTLVFPSVIY